MSRLFRISSTLAAVLTAYWVYALVAVPWIEPPPADRLPGEDFDYSQPLPDASHGELARLFPADAWERKEPKVLESEQFMLLLGEYMNLEGGQVKLWPCTMVFLPEGKLADPAERVRGAIVLQAPEAVLKFDQPLDLRRGNVGRLMAGCLNGAVTIRSSGRKPDSEDDLLIATRDLELTEQRLGTAQGIEFWLGPNQGRGAGVEIKFLPGEPGGGGRHGLNVGGVERFVLHKLDFLRLQMKEEMVGLGQQPADKALANRPAELPVEITCQGPFSFDAIRNVATFRDRVNVIQPQPGGQADQLTAETLRIHFAQRSAAGAKAAATEKGRSATTDLEPRRIEAEGQPAIVHAPSQRGEARGQWLQYDLRTREIGLDGRPEAFLRQGANEIHTPQLRYRPGAGTLGEAAAQGPGWLRFESPQRPGEMFTAQWSGELRVGPYDQRQQLVSLIGNARVGYHQLGQLQGGRLDLWCSQRPDGVGKTRIQPETMRAAGRVTLSSPQLTGVVEKMEVWFEPPAAGATSPVPGGQAAPVAPPGRTPAAPASFAQAPPVRSPYPTRPAGAAIASQGPQTPPRHFHVSGQSLSARTILSEPSLQVAELILDGNVRLDETQSGPSPSQPMRVDGQQVHVVDADKPIAAVTITGSPAHFEAQGLTLDGGNINLNRGANRLWIDGPGTMSVPAQRDLQGRAAADGDRLAIQWQEKMELEGKTLNFAGAVVAETRTQRMRTETLEVGFREPVQFDGAAAQARPEIERVACRGGVVMESRTLDPRGALASVERMELARLAANLQSGELTGDGPGKMASVRLGKSVGEVAGPRPRPAAPPAGPPAAALRDDELVYVEVRFQRGLSGNLHRHVVSFHERVETVYGPVPHWDASLALVDPDRLGPRSYLMRCDQLTLGQVVAPGPDHGKAELEAVGNAKVEGQTFTARAPRITYAQAKDLLVLEGNGLADATLFQQPQRPGDAPQTLSMKRIEYYPGASTGKVVGPRSLQFVQPGGDGGRGSLGPGGPARGGPPGDGPSARTPRGEGPPGLR